MKQKRLRRERAIINKILKKYSQEKNPITRNVVTAFRSGDDGAFNKIYNYYFKRLYFFAYNQVNDSELAKDIVQNTFISAYRSIHKLHHVEAFHTWLMRIAYCECKNVFRKYKLKQVELGEHQDIEMFVDDVSPSTPEQFEDATFYEVVNNEIQSMNYKLKSVAILKYFEGLNEEEISQVLKIPKGTVKSRLFKVKRILKSALIHNDITPSTYKTNYAMTLPTILISTYAYLNEKCEIPPANYQEIMHATSLSTTVTATGVIALLFSKRAIASMAILLTTISGIGLVLYLQDDLEARSFGVEKYKQPTKDPCRIASIVYDKEFTNKPILLEVSLTNSNFDKILINGEETLYIHENGEYLVTVLKDNDILDEQVFVVNNIDKEQPQYLYYEIIENKCVVHMNDDLSKIDAQSIQYFKNSIKDNNFVFDQKEQTITFNYEEHSSNEFLVSDNAKNVVKITVISEFKYLNNLVK